MAKLSDTIEEFIMSMLEACDYSVDLRRNDLAKYFNCVPSQINYVIATRFTQDKGYVIESKKGGGGYIRIAKLVIDENDVLYDLVTNRIGQSISLKECEDILFRLLDLDLINQREQKIILSSLKDVPIPINQNLKDALRANIFKSILTSIM